MATCPEIDCEAALVSSRGGQKTDGVWNAFSALWDSLFHRFSVLLRALLWVL